MRESDTDMQNQIIIPNAEYSCYLLEILFVVIVIIYICESLHSIDKWGEKVDNQAWGYILR